MSHGHPGEFEVFLEVDKQFFPFHQWLQQVETTKMHLQNNMAPEL